MTSEDHESRDYHHGGRLRPEFGIAVLVTVYIILKVRELIDRV